MLCPEDITKVQIISLSWPFSNCLLTLPELKFPGFLSFMFTYIIIVLSEFIPIFGESIFSHSFSFFCLVSLNVL